MPEISPNWTPISLLAEGSEEMVKGGGGPHPEPGAPKSTMFGHKIDEDLELRLLEDRDADELFKLLDHNRKYLRQWLPWVDGTKAAADTREFIRKSLDKFARNDGFNAGLWYRGRLAGVIGYHGIDWPNRATALGYWLGEAFQGRGLMTRVRALVDHAFRDLGLNRVEVRCATENRRSRAIPERLGFRQEGVSRQAEWLYDRFVDLVVYGMVAEEWEGVPRPHA